MYLLILFITQLRKEAPKICGLVAMIAKRENGFFTPDADIFKQMLYADAVRGWDATGVFGVNKHGNVDVKKQAVAAGSFLINPSYSEFNSKVLTDYRILVGHNRKATHGEKRDTDSHPFWSEDENIVLVHNGMIRNHKELCDVATVDSAAVCNAISKGSPLEVLNKVEGMYAFIWYNVQEKKYYFVRNEDRPLSIIETDNLLIMASESEMAHWILARHKIKVNRTVDIKENILYSITLGTNKIDEEGKVMKQTPFFQSTTVKYLPAKTSIPPTLEKQIGSTTETYNLDDTCYLTDKELPNLKVIQEKYKVGKEVCFLIDTYTEEVDESTGEITYTVIGKPINQVKTKITVLTHMSKLDFDLANFTQVMCGKIINAYFVQNKPTEFRLVVDNLQEFSYQETANEMIVTETMFTDSVFPDKCDVCRTPLLWNLLPKSTVTFKYTNVDTCLCPSCTRKFKNATNPRTL